MNLKNPFQKNIYRVTSSKKADIQKSNRELENVYNTLLFHTIDTLKQLGATDILDIWVIVNLMCQNGCFSYNKNEWNDCLSNNSSKSLEILVKHKLFLNGHGYRPYIDGEGRYYHKGLYLSKSKYKNIVKSTKTGPKMWGCKLYDNFVNRYKANGFTCSGFVTWAMYNGGFETGDVGAGDYKQFNDDLSDLGPHKKITQEYMKRGNYKVGDFIARNGHAALIIGISDTTIYTAESLPPKLKVYTYERYKGIVNDPNLTYVIEMSDIYPNRDGITTDMW